MELKAKCFTIVKGKWRIGNLNDKLVRASFDFFVNLKRQHPIVIVRSRPQDLKRHNYTFKEL